MHGTGQGSKPRSGLACCNCSGLWSPYSVSVFEFPAKVLRYLLVSRPFLGNIQPIQILLSSQYCWPPLSPTSPWWAVWVRGRVPGLLRGWQGLRPHTALASLCRGTRGYVALTWLDWRPPGGHRCTPAWVSATLLLPPAHERHRHSREPLHAAPRALHSGTPDASLGRGCLGAGHSAEAVGECRRQEQEPCAAAPGVGWGDRSDPGKLHRAQRRPQAAETPQRRASAGTWIWDRSGKRPGKGGTAVQPLLLLGEGLLS